MDDKKPKQYELLDEKAVRGWISLIMKVNSGFELDEGEIEKLGRGFMIFEFKNAPDDMKAAIKKAENYFKLNSTKN